MSLKEGNVIFFIVFYHIEFSVISYGIAVLFSDRRKFKMNQNFRNPLSERMIQIVNKKCPQILKKQNRSLIFPKDILLEIFDQSDSATFKILEISGVDLPNIKKDVQKIKINYEMSADKPELHPFTLFILNKADKIATEMRNDTVGTEHVILSFLSYCGKESSISVYKAILNKYGLDYSGFKNAVKNYVSNPRSLRSKISKMNDTKQENQDKKNVEVSQFLKNMNLEIDYDSKPFIGRDKEIERLATILSRKTKNNAIIIGEEGIGKTALVEGFVKRIINGDVPDNIYGATVFSMDMAAILAGTKYRGQFEERLKNVIKFLSNEEDSVDKNYILFIDEIHHIIGTGSAEGTPLDAGAILKSELSSGFRCIGTTTIKEYKNYIAANPPLARRFSPLFVDEPSIEDTIEILNGIKLGFESHHKVRVSKDTIRKTVVLCDRYIKDKNFPDKAIDVLDEACAKKNIRKMKTSENMSIESKINEILEKIDFHKKRNEYETCASLVLEREELSKSLAEISSSILNIDEEDISNAISELTGIPLGKDSKDEQNRLMKMEDDLNLIIINQKDAVNKVCMAVQRSRAGLKDPDKPAGIFLFLGETGVGKTFVAKNIAKFLFGSEDKLIRLDMSEYMEKHSMSKIVGSPPGYVGYGEYGKLTDFVKSKPYSVILLDEFEKAHPDIANLFLQTYDEGRMTDSSGTLIDFRNTIIIMTSNIGVEKLGKRSMGFGSDSKSTIDKEREAILMAETKKRFPPEFINRIDEVIVFNSLDIDAMNSIFDIEFSKVIGRLKEKGIKLSCDDLAKKFLISKGFDEKYGARPLKRTIQRLVENVLAAKIVRGEIDFGSEITVSYVQGSDEPIFEIKTGDK